MDYTNSSNSEYYYIYCRNDCGARITFSNNAISKNGRKIPLEENGRPHNCPKSYFNIRKQAPEENASNFSKDSENTEDYANVDSQEQHSDSSQKKEQYSPTLNHRITVGQQQYVDTIGPSIAKILTSSSKILSLLQEIHQHILTERQK